MKVACPSCRRDVPPKDVNVGTDTAFCRVCAEAFRVSDLLPSVDPEPVSRVDLDDPPSGAFFRRTFDGFELGATTRSPMAFFIVPFFLVWSGGSIGMLYGSMIVKGQFDPLTALFGIPFVIVSACLAVYALLLIAGRTKITVDRGEGVVFTGVGPIGRTKRFRWDEVDTVREEISFPWSRGGGSNIPQHTLVLEGKVRVRFGGLLREGRRYYMYEALKVLLAERR